MRHDFSFVDRRYLRHFFPRFLSDRLHNPSAQSAGASGCSLERLSLTSFSLFLAPVPFTFAFIIFFFAFVVSFNFFSCLWHYLHFIASSFLFVCGCAVTLPSAHERCRKAPLCAVCHFCVNTLWNILLLHPIFLSSAIILTWNHLSCDATYFCVSFSTEVPEIFLALVSLA